MGASVARVISSNAGPERIALEHVPDAAQLVRSRIRLAIGDELLATVRGIDDEVANLADLDPDGEDTVWLHPATTVHDLTWLERERSAILGPVLLLHQETKAEDNGWVGGLRGRVQAQVPILRRASALCVELARFEDGDLGGASTVDATRRAIAASIRGFRAAIETLVAEDPNESAEWLLAVDGSFEAWGVAHADLEELAGISYEDVSRDDVLEHAYGARPTGSPDQLEEVIAAYRDLDPYSPENFRPSRHFPRLSDEQRRTLRRGDRILVFAERQLRSIGLPAPPLRIEIVHDCFQLGWRLAMQACPTLAHICAREMARLLLAGLIQDADATTERLLRFNVEDAPLIIDAASRAQRDMAASEVDPIMALSGQGRLLEGVVRPWLRFVLDLLDISERRRPRGLPATIRLGQVVDLAAASAGATLLIPLLVDPIDPALRNADAHERARIGLDQLVHIHGDAGEVIKRVPLTEIHGRFWALRSAFAGVDCASSAVVHGLRVELPEGITLHLTPESLRRMVQITAMAADQPDVERVEMLADGTFVVGVGAEWAKPIAQATAEGIGRIAGEVVQVVFRSPKGNATYRTR